MKSDFRRKIALRSNEWAGHVSDGAFNPAIAVGAAFMGLLTWSSIWVHLVADLLGGAVAAVAFKTLSLDDK